MISCPKIVKSALLGLIFTGLAGSSSNAQAISFDDLIRSYSEMQEMVPQSVKTAGLVAAFVVPAISSYLALTQDEQLELYFGSDFEKAINWYRRIVCGKASKKTQVLKPNGEIKDCYSPSSGIFGKGISWYEANEKDVKKAVGIGAIPIALIAGWMTFVGLQEFLIAHALKAPWGEGFAKIK